MKIHLRDGDKLDIGLPCGHTVTIGYQIPDLLPDTVPQLEILLPQTMTVNLWGEQTEKVGDFEAQQIVVPLNPSDWQKEAKKFLKGN